MCVCVCGKIGPTAQFHVGQKVSGVVALIDRDIGVIVRLDNGKKGLVPIVKKEQYYRFANLFPVGSKVDAKVCNADPSNLQLELNLSTEEKPEKKFGKVQYKWREMTEGDFLVVHLFKKISNGDLLVKVPHSDFGIGIIKKQNYPSTLDVSKMLPSDKIQAWVYKIIEYNAEDQKNHKGKCRVEFTMNRKQIKLNKTPSMAEKKIDPNPDAKVLEKMEKELQNLDQAKTVKEEDEIPELDLFIDKTGEEVPVDDGNENPFEHEDKDGRDEDDEHKDDDEHEEYEDGDHDANSEEERQIRALGLNLEESKTERDLIDDENDDNDEDKDMEDRIEPNESTEKIASMQPEILSMDVVSKKELSESKGNVKVPESPKEFEKLLVSSPNSSVIWIRYSAFYLGKRNVGRARQILKRALEVILDTEERERLNIWIAWMNLEYMYGTEETLLKIFKSACKNCDEKDCYLKFVEILSRDMNKTDPKHKELTYKYYNQMLTKFSHDKQVYIAYGKFLFDEFKRTKDIKYKEDARNILKKGLYYLNSNRLSQISLIQKFALYVIYLYIYINE
ncbi:rRNA biogenesis protein [Reticulomyxa filosa]|uniref:rRNA biogenesis protein n=1 Tax=Reticulomyxa filosa TaxID=46433 RepID=X6NNH6_RETFI|nr:rRNA biogenesis protein [Reticulomyxa filosa]|eukprot:ETO27551.1 rRNA biogenesis protein [Reticulomyxa filosa]